MQHQNQQPLARKKTRSILPRASPRSTAHSARLSKKLEGSPSSPIFSPLTVDTPIAEGLAQHTNDSRSPAIQLLPPADGGTEAPVQIHGEKLPQPPKVSPAVLRALHHRLPAYSRLQSFDAPCDISKLGGLPRRLPSRDLRAALENIRKSCLRLRQEFAPDLDSRKDDYGKKGRGKGGKEKTKPQQQREEAEGKQREEVLSLRPLPLTIHRNQKADECLNPPKDKRHFVRRKSEHRDSGTGTHSGSAPPPDLELDVDLDSAPFVFEEVLSSIERLTDLVGKFSAHLKNLSADDFLGQTGMGTMAGLQRAKSTASIASKAGGDKPQLGKRGSMTLTKLQPSAAASAQPTSALQAAILETLPFLPDSSDNDRQGVLSVSAEARVKIRVQAARVGSAPFANRPLYFPFPDLFIPQRAKGASTSPSRKGSRSHSLAFSRTNSRLLDLSLTSAAGTHDGLSLHGRSGTRDTLADDESQIPPRDPSEPSPQSLKSTRTDDALSEGDFMSTAGVPASASIAAWPTVHEVKLLQGAKLEGEEEDKEADKEDSEEKKREKEKEAEGEPKVQKRRESISFRRESVSQRRESVSGKESSPEKEKQAREKELEKEKEKEEQQNRKRRSKDRARRREAARQEWKRRIINQSSQQRMDKLTKVPTYNHRILGERGVSDSVSESVPVLLHILKDREQVALQSGGTGEGGVGAGPEDFEDEPREEHLKRVLVAELQLAVALGVSHQRLLDLQGLHLQREQEVRERRLDRERNGTGSEGKRTAGTGEDPASRREKDIRRVSRIFGFLEHPKGDVAALLTERPLAPVSNPPSGATSARSLRSAHRPEPSRPSLLKVTTSPPPRTADTPASPSMPPSPETRSASPSVSPAERDSSRRVHSTPPSGSLDLLPPPHAASASSLPPLVPSPSSKKVRLFLDQPEDDRSPGANSGGKSSVGGSPDPTHASPGVDVSLPINLTIDIGPCRPASGSSSKRGHRRHHQMTQGEKLAKKERRRQVDKQMKALQDFSTNSVEYSECKSLVVSAAVISAIASAPSLEPPADNSGVFREGKQVESLAGVSLASATALSGGFAHRMKRPKGAVACGLRARLDPVKRLTALGTELMINLGAADEVSEKKLNNAFSKQKFLNTPVGDGVRSSFGFPEETDRNERGSVRGGRGSLISILGDNSPGRAGSTLGETYGSTAMTAVKTAARGSITIAAPPEDVTPTSQAPAGDKGKQRLSIAVSQGGASTTSAASKGAMALDALKPLGGRAGSPTNSSPSADAAAGPAQPRVSLHSENRRQQDSSPDGSVFSPLRSAATGTNTNKKFLNQAHVELEEVEAFVRKQMVPDGTALMFLSEELLQRRYAYVRALKAFEEGREAHWKESRNIAQYLTRIGFKPRDVENLTKVLQFVPLPSAPKKNVLLRMSDEDLVVLIAQAHQVGS
uniref:Uncharacterized protein n=1 Tax=Chromera velia CCMP2878 TaxID=1169474 RepID=A0A0G4GF28_9ALVE|eukprot:Cvel_4620.t1-p1 / transcript=Cvel_4620.t1 / gene=Cvel_4620 / organism=Chromera_velia_CCMP2878 / gene_product=hypothetical protein / transcript_product=hypothetical protein / location=Cvel_scaffold203:52868-65390(+) / protein_length=1425 / sequence_SO=supercontig / SO=protein_coding / is_pseudo=false